MLDVKAKGTTLEKFQIVNLDSGRLSVPVPKWGFVHMEPYDPAPIGYKYYVKDSHTERLLRFMYDPENADERWAFENFEKIVLFFRDDNEQKCFEEYVDYNIGDLKKRVAECDDYDYIETESEKKTAGYKRSLRVSLILKMMLTEFREIDKQTF